ncbi:hypothetical protein HO173_004004 [Letharia columbiana]|uniref:Uncharacterized protein n=1 Tax=Letharia columbiana TaxID=112416 RepID=A0A8H6L6S7_9LECA|nr:uncharacterized protein HO173_004004 [Letharia columbiana]KAF6237803.1 hypothetical protein HO173_004004 [Letharia columbiana]
MLSQRLAVLPRRSSHKHVRSTVRRRDGPNHMGSATYVDTAYANIVHATSNVPHHN